MSLLGQIYQRLRTQAPRTINLGGYTVELPTGHRFDWYRLRHSRYDEPLSDLCHLLVKKYPDLRVIDIGANVGVTAALMARTPRVEVLCVEGNEAFLPTLRRNLARISPTSDIMPCYVGFQEGEVSGRIVTKAGTASLRIDSAAAGPILMRQLTEILSVHPKFKDSRLLKVDTDGLDAKIVMAASDVIRRMRPVLYIEYSPHGDREVEQECRAMIKLLADIGYNHFHVFDNFGNHMVRLSVDELHHLYALNAYVRASRRDLKPAIFYYDICAMTADDNDISDKLLEHYIEECGLL